jgi:hypothetical protein
MVRLDSRESITMTNVTAGNGVQYEIRINCHLGKQWLDWFDGLTVTNLPNGEATLTGELADQAALHGILNRIRDLGLTLIAVNRLEHAAGAN